MPDARKPFGSFAPAASPAKSKSKPKDKITRAAFLYMPPGKRGEDNAQCKSCIMWLAEHDRCIIHAADVVVDDDDSCGFYLPGSPARKGMGRPMGLVTPKESGLVGRQVRCDNCFYADHGSCGLYAELNRTMPAVFDLDEKIDADACCNAQTKK